MEISKFRYCVPYNAMEPSIGKPCWQPMMFEELFETSIVKMELIIDFFNLNLVPGSLKRNKDVTAYYMVKLWVLTFKQKMMTIK